MKRETALKVEVAKKLTAMQKAGEPLWFLKVHGHEMQRPGVPDFLLCYHGRFLAIELKVDTRLSPLQEYELQKISAARGSTLIAYSWRDVEALLRLTR